MVSKRFLVIAGFLVLAVAMVGFAWTQWASGNHNPSTGEQHDTSTYQNREPSIYQDPNELLEEASDEIPGFGGVFLSKRGTVLNVYLTEIETDPQKLEEIRKKIEEMFDVEPGLRLNVIKGNYTITQLSEWYDLMRSEGIWDQDGVFMTDLDEGKNELYIGVLSEWDVEGVYTFLEGLDIPREAVTVAVEEPPTH